MKSLRINRIFSQSQNSSTEILINYNGNNSNFIVKKLVTHQGSKLIALVVLVQNIIAQVAYKQQTFTIVLEVISLRSGCRHGQVVDFCLYPHVWQKEGKRALWSHFCKGTNPIEMDSTLLTQSSSKGPPLNIITLGVRIST